MRDEIIALANEALKSKDHFCTWYHTLEIKDGTRWAIVFAWMDWDNNNKWRLFGKVACQSINCIMQEYDIDWDYPVTEDGEDDDTEVSIANEKMDSIDEFDIDWLIKEWERIKKEYVDREDDR